MYQDCSGFPCMTHDCLLAVNRVNRKEFVVTHGVEWQGPEKLKITKLYLQQISSET